MIDISLPIAFTAGVISFFAPCVFPLLPAYIGYITGVSLTEFKKNSYGRYIKRILFSSLFYIIGFSIVFVLLGTAAAGFGAIFSKYQWLIGRIGGAIIIIFGLEFAGVLRIPPLTSPFSFRLPDAKDNLNYFRAFLVGIIFATNWAPCVGAVLGSILALAAISKTVVAGAFLLFVYSLGISFPFVIVSLMLIWAPRHLRFVGNYLGPISKFSGLLLALIGILLLTDTYKYLNSWFFDLFYRFGYRIR